MGMPKEMRRLLITVLGGLALMATACGTPAEPNEPQPEEEEEVVPDRVTGCDGAAFLDPVGALSEDGPWPVGAVNTQVNYSETEVWYPAVRGSQSGQDKLIYDIREVMPDAEGAKIADAENPWHHCNCYRDLPLDENNGPYPVMIFIHGTGGYRGQSLKQMTHWASHGYVVVAMDHPGLNLGDLLALQTSQNLERDVSNLLVALDALEEDLAFLKGHIDMNHLAMSGHSAGGTAVATEGDRAKVLIPMAAGGAQAGDRLAFSMVLAAQDDQIVNYASTQTAYDQTPAPKLFAGFASAGHLLFSDICELGRDGGGLVQIAIDNGVSNAFLAAGLYDGCNAGQLYSDVGAPIINHLTTAVLDNILKCRSEPHDLQAIADSYSEVIDFSLDNGTSE